MNFNAIPLRSVSHNLPKCVTNQLIDPSINTGKPGTPGGPGTAGGPGTPGGSGTSGGPGTIQFIHT